MKVEVEYRDGTITMSSYTKVVVHVDDGIWFLRMVKDIDGGWEIQCEWLNSLHISLPSCDRFSPLSKKKWN